MVKFYLLYFISCPLFALIIKHRDGRFAFIYIIIYMVQDYGAVYMKYYPEERFLHVSKSVRAFLLYSIQGKVHDVVRTISD